MYILSILLFLPIASFAQHHGHQSDMNRQQQAALKKNIFLSQMDTMMRDMELVKLTNNPDVDFLSLMIPHHSGAILMARYEIANGKNMEMGQLAKSIEAEQQVEIQMMQQLLSTLSKPSLDKPSIGKDWDQTMETMMENMPKSEQLPNVDTAFAKVMIPHHQAAIDMAKVILKYGTNKNVKRLAEQIISTQQIEIEQMQTFTGNKK